MSSCYMDSQFPFKIRLFAKEFGYGKFVLAMTQNLNISLFPGYEATAFLYLQGSGFSMKKYYSFSALYQRLWSAFFQDSSSDQTNSGSQGYEAQNYQILISLFQWSVLEFGS